MEIIIDIPRDLAVEFVVVNQLLCLPTKYKVAKEMSNSENLKI